MMMDEKRLLEAKHEEAERLRKIAFLGVALSTGSCL